MLHRFLRLEGIRMARSSFELCPSSHQESKEADTDSSSCLSPPFMVQRDDPFAISITNHVTSFPAVTEVSDLLDRTACGTRVGILDGVRILFGNQSHRYAQAATKASQAIRSRVM